MAGLCTSTSRMFQLACSYRRLAATSHIRQLPALLAWRPRQLPAATRTRAVAGSDVGDSFSSHDFSSIAAGPGSDFITSVQNNYIKHCVKLRTSSAYRAEARRFMLVGSQIMREAAANGGQLEARVLFVPERRGGAAAADTVPWGVSAQHVVQVTPNVMKKLTGLESVDAVDAVAELDVPPQADFAAAAAAAAATPRGGGGGVRLRRLLALDRVQDPGNLGTLMRTALAFGWEGVFLLPGCCDPFNEKAVRASRGSVLRIPIATGTVGELRRIAVDVHNMAMLAAEPEDATSGGGGGSSSNSSSLGGSSGGWGQEDEGGALSGLFGGGGGGGGAAAASSSRIRTFEDLQAAVLLMRVCLVLGSEGQGLSPEAKAACRPVSIPMVGRMESLNVGVAGGVLMFLLSQGLPEFVSKMDTFQAARRSVSRLDDGGGIGGIGGIRGGVGGSGGGVLPGGQATGMVRPPGNSSTTYSSAAASGAGGGAASGRTLPPSGNGGGGGGGRSAMPRPGSSSRPSQQRPPARPASD